MNNFEPDAKLPTLRRVPWLAKLLGLSRKQTYEVIQSQQVPPEIILRIGRRIIIVEEKAIDWIMRGGLGAEGCQS